MRAFHVIELPELSDDEHLVDLIRDAWAQAVMERYPELARVALTLRETLVPRVRLGRATRLWCDAELPISLLQDFALELSRFFGTAVLFTHAPEGDTQGEPTEAVDDLGAFTFVRGVLDDEILMLMN